jgi:PHD/YefM family antitoxin component YafN of YafNO toxin-antitoxin module
MVRAMPTSEFVQKTEEISELCRTGEDPIILTRDGRGDMVVMGIQAYNVLLSELKLLRDVADANARLVENENSSDEDMIDQAVQAAHDKVQSHLRFSDAA